MVDGIAIVSVNWGVEDVNVSFVGASAPIVTGTTFIFVREPY